MRLQRDAQVVHAARAGFGEERPEGIEQRGPTEPRLELNEQGHRTGAIATVGPGRQIDGGRGQRANRVGGAAPDAAPERPHHADILRHPALVFVGVDEKLRDRFLPHVVERAGQRRPVARPLVRDLVQHDVERRVPVEARERREIVLYDDVRGVLHAHPRDRAGRDAQLVAVGEGTEARRHPVQEPADERRIERGRDGARRRLEGGRPTPRGGDQRRTAPARVRRDRKRRVGGRGAAEQLAARGLPARDARARTEDRVARAVADVEGEAREASGRGIARAEPVAGFDPAEQIGERVPATIDGPQEADTGDGIHPLDDRRPRVERECATRRVRAAHRSPGCLLARPRAPARPRRRATRRRRAAGGGSRARRTRSRSRRCARRGDSMPLRSRGRSDSHSGSRSRRCCRRQSRRRRSGRRRSSCRRSSCRRSSRRRVPATVQPRRRRRRARRAKAA